MNSIASPNCKIANYQNPFIGKELESIVQTAGLNVVAVYPFIIEFKGPIIGHQRAYLEALHKSWYVEDTLGILSASDKQTWSAYFDSRNVQNIFDNKDTVYQEAEFLVIGRKP